MKTSAAAKAGIASLMALVAAGAAQAETAPTVPTYNKALADQATFLVLDPRSEDEVEAGLATQIVISCMGAPVKQFAFQLTPEFSSLATGIPVEDYKNGSVAPEWLGFDCDTGAAWHGPHEVIDAKVAEMEAYAKRKGRSNMPPSNPVVHEGGVIIVGPDGGVQIRQDDYPVIEGSANPGPSGP